jgi:hypothetical protein
VDILFIYIEWKSSTDFTDVFAGGSTVTEQLSGKQYVNVKIESEWLKTGSNGGSPRPIRAGDLLIISVLFKIDPAPWS